LANVVFDEKERQRPFRRQASPATYGVPGQLAGVRDANSSAACVSGDLCNFLLLTELGLGKVSKYSF